MDYSTFTEAALEARLAELRQDHSDLEAAIQALSNAPLPELIVIGRFKRKKLALKDEISRVLDYLNPDIIA
ncbi:MAG: YdcH family protein [Alphaproteobacteria bacterium]|jgi:hypothetical protein